VQWRSRAAAKAPNTDFADFAHCCEDEVFLEQYVGDDYPWGDEVCDTCDTYDQHEG
jgi:hypothetical protein